MIEKMSKFFVTEAISEVYGDIEILRDGCPKCYLTYSEARQLAIDLMDFYNKKRC